MTTIKVLDALGAQKDVELPNANGQQSMAGSRPVVIASDQSDVPVVTNDITSTGTVAVGANSAPTSVLGRGGLGFVLGGTWTGTVTVEATIDGTRWDAISGVPVGGGLRVSAFTANGAWEGIAAGTKAIRINGTAVATGTVSYTILLTDDPRVIRVWSTNAANVLVTSYLNDGAGTPVTVGQKATAASLPVALASDQVGIPVKGRGTHYQPGFAIPTGVADAEVLVDPDGNLVGRSQVLTDEGGYRANFANASLSVSLGSCTFTNGSAVVTGTGFLTSDVSVGSYVKLDADPESAWNQVLDIRSNTQILLGSNYTGTGGTGASSRSLLKPVTGSGATISVASGVCTLAAGTTTGALTEIERDIDWLPVVKQTGVTISQRIANQSVYIGFYDENHPTTPYYFAWFLADGVTNTGIKCQSGRNPTGAPSGNEIEETFITLPNGATTATANRYRVEVLGDRVVFLINGFVVATHFRSMPGPGDLLTSTVRVLNGTSPASNTNILVDYDTVKNHNKVEVGILSDAEGVIAAKVPDTAYSYSVSGVISVNTDLLILDLAQFRQVSIQCVAMGTSGVVTAYQTNDLTQLGTAAAIYPVGATVPVTTFNAAGMWAAPKQGRYLRLRLTTATTAGTTTLALSASQDAFIPPTIAPAVTVSSGTVTTVSTVTSLSQIATFVPLMAVANGSTNRALGVSVATAMANTDHSAIAFAGAGRVNGAVVASALGGGVSCSFDINVTVTTLGTATSLLFVLQESYDSGTTWSDIWTSQPFTTSQHIRVPALPISGRRRWTMHNVGGTSTTVPATITAQELPGQALIQRQYVDVYAATNPMQSVINGTTVSSTLQSTVLNSGSTSASGVAIVEGCKNITLTGVFTGGTPTTGPTYALQISQDGTNWFTTSTTMTPGLVAGTYMATLANTCARFARAVTTVASSGGTPFTVPYIAINGTN